MISFIDIGIIILLILGIGYGIYRGLIKEIASIFVLIAAYFMASFHYFLISGLLTKYLFKDKITANLTGFLSIFLLSLGVLIYLVKVVQTASKIDLPTTIFNRIASGLLGLFRGILIISLLLMPFELYSSSSLEQGAMKQSRLIPYFRKGSGFFYKLSFSKLREENITKIPNVEQKPEEKSFQEEISESDQEQMDKLLKKEITP